MVPQVAEPVTRCQAVSAVGKTELARKLLLAKEASGKTFNQIAKECGLTNLYTAQLFFNQAQLKEATAPKLKAAVPGLDYVTLAAMKKAPIRMYDPQIIQDPLVYRINEAVMHYGEAIKAIANEEFGDGIASAIDMYFTLGETIGKSGEKRMVLTFNGKWLPHVEQRMEDNTA
ncbi:hypothetical protein WJX81_007030 [Elliptochloris bilobata]|uniref:Cyanate lyase C-terminal domain-containing protein n=1 Tax=Elliptochloris bilobata TaxID=381761 RepID=A0AAW1R2Y9_9CHLO